MVVPFDTTIISLTHSPEEILNMMETFSGAYLMNHGLEMPYRNEPEWSKKNDWSSRVLLLEAE